MSSVASSAGLPQRDPSRRRWVPRPADRVLAVADEATQPCLAASVLGFGIVATLGFADGGVLPNAWRYASLAFAAVVAGALLARGRIAFGRLEWALVASLASLAAWTALSAAWSGNPTVSLLQAERAGMYAVGGLAVISVAERRSVPYLLGGVLAAITMLASFGLVGYALRPDRLDPFQGRLLYEPLGYANALGILAALGILLATGLALRAHGLRLRIAALLPLPVLGFALLLTSSRGAILALAIGLVAFLALGGQVGRSRGMYLAGLGAVVVAVAVAASGWLSSPTDLVGETRISYWQVAWQDVRSHPLLGSAAGTFGAEWRAHGDPDHTTQTAHSVYLQSLAELGPLGLILVLAPVALLLARVRRRNDPIVAAASAGFLAFAVHAGIDWDWELPAVGLAGVSCLAAMLVAGRPEPSAALSPRVRLALLVPVLAFALVAALRLLDGPRMPFGP